MSGAPRGSGQSRAELPSPTVERSTKGEWWRDGGGGVRWESAPSALSSHWSERRRGGTRLESLAAIGQRRAEGGSRGVRTVCSRQTPVRNR